MMCLKELVHLAALVHELSILQVQLTCLSDASVTEHSCWCEGDYCNGMRRFAVTMVVGVTIWISCF